MQMHFSCTDNRINVLILHAVRVLAMPQPSDPDVNPLQRDLADSIILMLPLDEIRILLACGAKVQTLIAHFTHKAFVP